MVDSSTQTRAPSSQAAAVEGGFITAGMHTGSKYIYHIYQPRLCVCQGVCVSGCVF